MKANSLKSSRKLTNKTERNKLQGPEMREGLPLMLTK